MSVLYFAADAEVLAGKLAELIDAQFRNGDFFAPIDIVVPNRFLGRWLKLRLARTMGVAINLRFAFLETALWEWFRLIDPRPIRAPQPGESSSLGVHPAPPEFLDAETYRMLVLSVLLHENAEPLALFRHYLQRTEGRLGRTSCRRAWELAGLLGDFIRDYEYHRQHELIQPWLRDQLGLPSDLGAESLERGQREVFRDIVRLPDGKRQLLIDATGRNYKTLPQYVMEVREICEANPAENRLGNAAAPRQVHLFGLTQISKMHVEALRFLGPHFDLRCYHLNPLAGRLPRRLNLESIRKLAESFALSRRGDEPRAGDALLHLWGRAGAESLWLMSEFLSLPSFSAEALAPAAPKGRRTKPTVLSRLRDCLASSEKIKDDERLDQDTSLQIVGCPGILREVETVHNSILHNLRTNPNLRQTDIAVLAVDMTKYRPVLQAVFERPPQPLSYNLIDYSAAGLSAFGQALVGMFDLALESFSRSRVFDVLLNPCVLARLGVDHAEAMSWVDWADKLGIHEGWDAAEKKEQGLPAAPQFGWKLGLQRLRLGRFMTTVPDDFDGDLPHFGDIVPFADLESSDREKLDRFCLAIEGLLPRLHGLRGFRGSGAQWADRIRELVRDFLDVPENRPEEATVRDRLLGSLARLELWDRIAGPQRDAEPLPLALVREFLLTQLETIPGSRGQALVGGVTLSALQPMRPVPFEIVYVLGMGEKHFPGSNFLSALDLRNLGDRPRGDIRPAEHQRFLFLETLLSAGKKLYLCYDNRDLQKDEPLFPAVPVQQLRQFLDRTILREPFREAAVPLQGHDEALLDPNRQPAWQDVLVQYRDTDRLLAILDAKRKQRLGPMLFPIAELGEREEQLMPDFAAGLTDRPAVQGTPTIRLSHLKSFLVCPAEAMLKRHLRVEEEEERDEGDFEPLVTSRRDGIRLIRQVLQQIVRRSIGDKFERVLDGWTEHFDEAYERMRLRCKAPGEGFAEIDRSVLRQDLFDRLHGVGRLASFLRDRIAKPFVGPILLGESLTPVDPRLRFSAVEIDLARPLPHLTASRARLIGMTEFAWADETSLDVLSITQAKDWKDTTITNPILEPVLFYLALLAHDGTEGGASASEWMSKRDFAVHVAHNDGLGAIRYPAGLITPEKARDYLAELVADYLDPDQGELLPFPCLREKELAALFEAPWSHENAESFQTGMQDAIDEAGPWKGWVVDELVRRLDLGVPEHALKTMQRRFRLIGLGPALRRQAHAPLGSEEDSE